MRTSGDQLSKEIVRLQLEPYGQVRTEEEVSVEPQRIDTWFVPSEPRGYGTGDLLERMACDPCMLESFFKTPGVGQVRACVRKQLGWEQVLTVRARRKRRAPGPVRLWLVSSGRPASVIERLGFEPYMGWPEGVYALPAGWNVGLVVLRELPPVRETLMVRLTGSGATLKRAIAELLALPPSAPERRALRLLARMQGEVMENMKKRSPTARERDFLEGTRDIVEEFREEGRKEGRKQGHQEARQELRAALIREYARRFGECPQDIEGAINRIADGARLVDLTFVVAKGTRRDIARGLTTEERVAPDNGVRVSTTRPSASRRRRR